MRATLRKTMIAGTILGLFGAGLLAEARAQIVEASAFVGEPLGVGRLVIDLPQSALPVPLGVDGLGLSEKAGRVLYPAIHNPAIPGVVKNLLGGPSPLTTGGPVREQVGGILRGVLNRPPRTTIYFLFRGDGPLELTLQGRESLPLVIQPQLSPIVHRRLLQLWWSVYAAAPSPLQTKPDYPPLIDTYLVSTLARRLNLQLPQGKQTLSAYAQFERELGVLTGTESVRTALQQDRLLGLTNLDLPAEQPLPPAEQPAPLVVPEPPADTKVEPMAMHVPAEFFYLRFGSFDNFVWFQDTLDTWGGDLQNLVAKRGIDQGRNDRLQEQLVLKQTQLSRLLGGTVISDVAIVGTDMLFREGAAYGFLFEARSNLLLTNSMKDERDERLKKGGVTEQKMKIEGQEVSLLSAPDGSVRSYYVASGDYRFVTSSKALAARFLQTAGGKGSLGASKEFRYARSLMPISRGDAVFVYLSDAFFRNITGPRYRLEMLRRLEAVTDIELVLLAKLNAATEGRRGGTIEELIAGGVLPPGFGRRPDGSQAVLAQGEVIDSLRGRRGWFVPVPDMPATQVTRAEAESYRKFAEVCRQQWGRIEPITVAVQRKTLPGKQEQVVLDIRMTPLSRQRVEFFRTWAGSPEKTQLAAVPGNVAAFDAVLQNQRLFGGVRDVAPPTAMGLLQGGLAAANFMPWDTFRNTVIGYLGSTGQRGILGVLDATFPPPDPNGFSRNLLGLWRLDTNPFTLYSFQPDVLQAVLPQLRFEGAQRPAQLRLRVGDVTHVRITPVLNNWLYGRTRETAVGNLRLLHAVNQQLHVPPKDCRDAVEFLLAAKLVCPLGGQYVVRDAGGGVSQWTSTKLEPAADQSPSRPQAPEAYVAPPLSWFRGLDLDASLIDNVLAAHAEVIMQLPTGK